MKPIPQEEIVVSANWSSVVTDRLLRQISALQTVRVQNEKSLRELTHVSSVVVVGSTCSGKTTIVDAIRKSHLSLQELVVVPLRYITRPKRGKDNTVENAHVTEGEFQKKVDAAEIILHWIRQMEEGREERYGFHAVPVGKFPIYSGNNALYNNFGSVQPTELLKHAVFVGVYAPDEIRKHRLISRSPDLLKDCPEEVEYRLGDSAENMLPHVHLVIENHGAFESLVEKEAVQLIKEIISNE